MRRALATVAIGVTMLAGGGVGLLWPARAQQSGVGIYDLVTSAAAVRQIIDTQNNPLPTETTADFSAPYALAALSTGSGHGIGSTLWPGDAAANACAAVPEFPCYPFRAETFHPQGPAAAKNDQIPGSVMESVATEHEVRSVAATAGQGAEIGGTAAHALSTVKDGLAVSEALSSVESINLGGQVKIEKVVSYSKATSDGAKAEVTGRTVVVGLTIGGQPAQIDENGVTIGGQSSGNPLVPGGPLTPLTDVLQQAGITLTLANPIKTIEGGKGEVVTGGLIITIDNNPIVSQIPPAVLAAIQVPGVGGVPPLGGKTTIILGQTSASASGNPGFGEFLPGDITESISDLGTPVESVPVEEVPSGSVEVSGATETATQELGAGAVRPAAPVTAGSSRSLIAGEPVSAALVILSLVGAGLAGFGLRKLATGVFAAGGATTCPLESS